MDTATDRLFEQALDLPPADRRDLAARLIDSLGIDSLEDEATDTPEEIEAAWAEEIRRRLADIDAGKTKLMSMSEFERRMIEP
jgi:putative addiction module component (TIGR02574 family)